jgi:DNA-directed RNA polymerase specialized sigma24 family protein
MPAVAGAAGVKYPGRVMRFPATRRSVLERVRSGDEAIRRDAFGDLAAGYWKPSYHYLRLQWRLTPEEAEDAVQAFFATAFEKQYVERYDPAKSKFRTFLRVCLDRYVQNLRKAAAAEKRGGGAALLSLDFPGAERELDEMAAEVGDADRFFHDETVRFLFARTLASLQAACVRDGREIVFRVFERHDVAPSADTSYATVAGDLHLTVSQVTNHLHSARKLFRDLALGHLRALSASDEEFARDARELFGLDVSS